MADFSTLINTNNVRNVSITTPKIADSNITNGKMATDSVNTSQLVAGSVTTAKVASTAITAAKLNADTAGAGLALDASAGLSVNVERGLQLPADAVGIADSGGDFALLLVETKTPLAIERAQVIMRLEAGHWRLDLPDTESLWNRNWSLSGGRNRGPPGFIEIDGMPL